MNEASTKTAMNDSGVDWDYPVGRFDWPKPVSLEIGAWDDWHDDMKAKYPVRFFIYETIPDFWDDIWSFGIVKKLSNIKWWFFHRFHPKHRYNVIKTSLKPGYHDPDNRMFYAAFNLLCEFVEEAGDMINWEDEAGHSKAWKEMSELYDWWNNIRPHREERWENENPKPTLPDHIERTLGIFAQKNRELPEVIKYHEYLSKYNEATQQWEVEDDDMFIRLIKIRRYLWYP